MVENLAEALYTAINNSDYLPDVEYRHKTREQIRNGEDGNIEFRRPRVDEVDVFHFPQTWGSTSLGFGGMGGAMITKAYTTVVVLQRKHAVVFFNGCFAYKTTTNDEFYSDLKNFRMASVYKSDKYSI